MPVVTAEQHPVRRPGPRGPVPEVIQGGMGVAVSSWRLARAVSVAGGLGVISGTALGVVPARRLQTAIRAVTSAGPSRRPRLPAWPSGY